MSFINSVTDLHNAIFGAIKRYTEGWLVGLMLRLIFASTLMYYFLNSACTKVENGCQYIASIPLPNSLTLSAGSYGQIIPPIAEEYGFDATAIPFFPWKIIVGMGTFTEFILPILLFLGLFTRLTSLAFIGFIAVMTYVDINFHGVDVQTIGNFFDKIHNSAIADQRLLWLAPLLTLLILGPGKISLDYLLGRARGNK